MNQQAMGVDGYKTSRVLINRKHALEETQAEKDGVGSIETIAKKG